MSLESTSITIKPGTHFTATHNVTHGSCFLAGRGKGGNEKLWVPWGGGGEGEKKLWVPREGKEEMKVWSQGGQFCTTDCGP